MPIEKYFGGHGDEVMAKMRQTYKNPKKAKSVFYATANKEHETAKDEAKAALSRPSRKK